MPPHKPSKSKPVSIMRLSSSVIGPINSCSNYSPIIAKNTNATRNAFFVLSLLLVLLLLFNLLLLLLLKFSVSSLPSRWRDNRKAKLTKLQLTLQAWYISLRRPLVFLNMGEDDGQWESVGDTDGRFFFSVVRYL